MDRRVTRVVLSAVVLALGVACAGRRLSPIDQDVPLPPEMAEAEDKFAVKEMAPTEPTSEAALSETTSAAVAVPVSKPSVAAKGEKPVKSAVFKYPVRRLAKDPIWVGEKHVFSITYLGLSAGDFILDILPNKAVNNREVYHAKGSVKSSPVFSLFYKLDDYIETFWDFQGLFSHRFHLVQDESKQYRDSLELFDHEKKQTFYWNRLKHKDRGYQESKESQAIKPFGQDVFSSLLYLRTLPLPTGAVVTFPVVSEGKTYEAVMTVVRREKISTPMGKYDAIVLKPQAKHNGVLVPTKGESFIWLSDDDRRYMLRVEAKVKIGTIIAACKQIVDGEPRL